MTNKVITLGDGVSQIGNQENTLSMYVDIFGVVAYDNQSYALLDSGTQKEMQISLDLMNSLAPDGVNISLVDLRGMDLDKIKDDALYAKSVFEGCLYH